MLREKRMDRSAGSFPLQRKEGKKERCAASQPPCRIAASMRANAAPMSPRVRQPASSTSPGQLAALHPPAPVGKHANKLAHPRTAVTRPKDAGRTSPIRARATGVHTHTSACESEDVRRSTSPARQRTSPPHQPQQKESSCGSEGENIPMRQRATDVRASKPGQRRAHVSACNRCIDAAAQPGPSAHSCIPTVGKKVGSGHTAPDAPVLPKRKHGRKCPSVPEHRDGRAASTAHPSS
ncbi:hypothetical protein C8J57DRAFT_1588630 [Mycena rebaudengoi]|nr:hypothetical protein C8J57DRAFT_1588630 [Mycena rebaudengoi]